MEQMICPNCEQGTVINRRAPGRMATVFPGLRVELPADLELPTCDNCVDYSVPESMEERVQRAVEVAVLNWQKRHAESMIAQLCERHRITRKRLAAALGVTPAHLSHVTAASKPASETLLRLLRAFVMSPAQLDDALRARPLEDTVAAPVVRAEQPSHAWTGQAPLEPTLVMPNRRLTPPRAFPPPVFSQPLLEREVVSTNDYEQTLPDPANNTSKASVAA